LPANKSTITSPRKYEPINRSSAEWFLHVRTY
jgi:hypothetical protein